MQRSTLDPADIYAKVAPQLDKRRSSETSLAWLWTAVTAVLLVTGLWPGAVVTGAIALIGWWYRKEAKTGGVRLVTGQVTGKPVETKVRYEEDKDDRLFHLHCLTLDIKDVVLLTSTGAVGAGSRKGLDRVAVPGTLHASTEMGGTVRLVVLGDGHLGAVLAADGTVQVVDRPDWEEQARPGGGS